MTEPTENASADAPSSSAPEPATSPEDAPAPSGESAVGPATAPAPDAASPSSGHLDEPKGRGLFIGLVALVALFLGFVLLGISRLPLIAQLGNTHGPVIVYAVLALLGTLVLFGAIRGSANADRVAGTVTLALPGARNVTLDNVTFYAGGGTAGWLIMFAALVVASRFMPAPAPSDELSVTVYCADTGAYAGSGVEDAEVTIADLGVNGSNARTNENGRARLPGDTSQLGDEVRVQVRNLDDSTPQFEDQAFDAPRDELLAVGGYRAEVTCIEQVAQPSCDEASWACRRSEDDERTFLLANTSVEPGADMPCAVCLVQSLESHRPELAVPLEGRPAGDDDFAAIQPLGSDTRPSPMRVVFREAPMGDATRLELRVASNPSAGCEMMDTVRVACQ